MRILAIVAAHANDIGSYNLSNITTFCAESEECELWVNMISNDRFFAGFKDSVRERGGFECVKKYLDGDITFYEAVMDGLTCEFKYRSDRNS